MVLAFGMGTIIAGEVSTVSDLRSALTGSGNGATVTIGSGLGNVDLAGSGIVVNGSNVTLQGQAAYNMGNEIRARVSGIGATSINSMTRSGLDGDIGGLISGLLANRPGTTISNSAAATGTHAGISAPGGGFSIRNLSFVGTTANIDATSGASKYMGLVGSTFTRQNNPADGQGMKSVENVAFVNNVVRATGGVNIVGNTLFFSQRRYNGSTYASGQDRIETLDSVKGSLFVGNKTYADMTASVGMRDIGAGGAGWVNINSVDSSVFANNSIQGHHAFGAGLHVYSLGSLTDSVFYNNINESDHDGYGGGLYAGGGIDSISNSVFVGNEARGLDFGLGRAAGALGGAINSTGDGTAMGYARSGIGSISNSLFAFNRAYNETGEEANGGAINVGRRLGAITGTTFYGNVAESDGDAFGGAIALGVNVAGMSTSIVDSSFIGNKVISGGESGGGAISIATTTAAATNYTLNLKATNGGVTRFAGNTVNGKAEGIYVGRLASTGTDQTDVTINIDAASGGMVAMEDPIRVNLNNGKAFTLNNIGSGRFVWGGKNDLSAAGGSTVKFSSGKNVTLAKDFSLSSSQGNAVAVDFDGGANVDMVLFGRNQNAAMFKGVTVFNNTKGAKLSAEYYSFTDYDGTWLVAEGGAAPSVNTADFSTASGSQGVSLALSKNAGKLYVNLSYKGPDAVFNAASSNARASRPALQEAWESISPGLTMSEQRSVFNEILGNIDNFNPQAFLSHGMAALDFSRGIAIQAIRADYRSRNAIGGDGEVSALSSGSALASIAGGATTYDYCNNAAKVRMWADYIGSRVDQDGRDSFSGYDARNNGVVVGGSYDLGKTWSLGAYLSYSDGSTDYDDIAASIDSDIYQGGVFAQYRSDVSGWVGSFDIGYTRFENDSVRYALNRLDASYDQDVVGGGLEVGYEFNPWTNGRVTPFAGVRYEHLWQSNIRESGGPFAMNVDSTDADSFASSLGVNLAHDFIGRSASVTPNVYAAWRHEFADREMSGSARYANFTTIPRYDSIKKDRDSLEAGASLSSILARTESFSFGVNGGYNASISESRVEHTFYGGLEVKF